MIINIQDDILKLHALGLLDRMLMDRTTKQHIMWATGAYTSLGEQYEYDQEMTPDLIIGEHSSVIRTRARKAMEQQSARTRQHAEVFTPLWICRKMNDYADEMWFGRKEVFFTGDAPTAAVVFPKQKKWERYVSSRRLEITCGEAPYLVSRYDVETGEKIPIRERVGLLDRKLRVVGENAQTEAEWLKWSIRAFCSTYGYEFQGDNVLIARVNLLMTFEEYLQERWKRRPTRAEYEKIANIIVWNIWQMDGLTGTIPYGTPEEAFQQIDWFGLLDIGSSEESNKQPPCQIRNWTGGGSVEFLSLPVRGKKAMKFDFIIGNPPYQDETIGDNKGFAPPIYHRFLEEAYKTADVVELIHPARFLFNAGSTPKQWNQQMLNSTHLKVLYYDSNAKNIFPNTAITGGIAITLYNAKENYAPIEIFSPYVELNSIRQKVVVHPKFKSISGIMSGRTPYLFTDKMHEENLSAKDKLSKGHLYDVSSNAFVALSDIFLPTKPDDDVNYYRILGRYNNMRTYRWIKKVYVRGRSEEFIGKWKIFLPKANGASGMLGEEAARLISKPVVGMPNDVATDTFICVGSFSTGEEADAALKYLNGKFCRVLLGVLKVTQDNSPDKWAYVPLQDFTSASDIDWSKSIPDIDQQLYQKYGLDEKEMQFIESHVKEMA